MAENKVLTDKDFLQDMLASEKHLISSYSTGISESSCTNLRSTLIDNFKTTQDIQYRVFDAMKQKGWYQTKDALDSDVQQVKNDVNQMMGQLQ